MSGPVLDYTTSALQIVDGNNYLHNRFREGQDGLIMRNLLNDIRQCKRPPLFVFDGIAGNERRRKLFPGYKVRKDSPKRRDDVHSALNLFLSLVPLMPCVTVRLHDWEADDVMATIARHQAVQGHKSRVITTDRDLSQLMMDKMIEVTASFEDLAPHEVRLYKTFIGDNSDRIPGVKNFGPKSWDSLNKALITQIMSHKSDFADYAPEHLGLAQKHYDWIVMHQGLLQTYWQIIQLFDVPMCEIKPALRVGIDKPFEVNSILREFML